MRGRLCADEYGAFDATELGDAETQLLAMLRRVREARAAAAPAPAAPPRPLRFYNPGMSEPSEREVDVWSLLTLKKLNGGSQDA